MDLHLAPTLAAAAAAVACAVAARRTAGPTRNGWALFALAALAWSVGRSGVEGHLVPVRVLASVMATMAAIQWVRPALTLAGGVRIAIDGLAVGLSFLFLTWPSVFAPVIEGDRAGLDVVLALAPPFGDLAALAVVVVAGGRLRAASRHRWALVTGALVLFGIADGAFAYLRLDELLHLAGANDLAWVAGGALLALAALAPSGDVSPLAQEATPTRAFHIVLAYAPFLIASAEAASRLVTDTLDAPSVLIAVLLAAALFLRQLAAQLETLSFTRHLDRLVRERTTELHGQERRFRALVQHASDVLTVLDHDLRVRYQSAAAEHVFGTEVDELLGQSLDRFVHPGDLDAFVTKLVEAPPAPAPPVVVEARMLRADGTWAITETRVSNLLNDPGVEGLLLTTRDVSERKRLEDQLRYEALHDPLTGLSNRVLFHERLVHSVAVASRDPLSVAVLVLDLDGFKSVNDTLGHAAGDRLLIEVAARLAAAVRPGDTVARIGGDEFAVLIEKADAQAAEVVAGRVLSLLRVPLEIDGRTIVPSGSIGVAVGVTSQVNADELLQSADLAMYTAKTSGKGRYKVFEEGMHEAAMLRVELEADLRRAIDDDELVLHFQPIVELPSGRVSGAEALIRWQHPKRGLLAPRDFLGVAEESELIEAIGGWVLDAAARHLQLWERRYGVGRFFVSVNVASRQLVGSRLVDEVRAVLAETGIAPGSLLLEITEGALMAGDAPIDGTLQRLKSLGVQLAIDDFGTGWSSLSRLRDFPVDKLKIDRAFVREIAAPDQDVPLIAAVVGMAHSLDLHVVAEGVETLEQLACLHQLGIEEVQGYLLARPLAAEDLELMLEDPTGLLDGPDEAVTSDLHSQDHADFLGLVTSAALETPDASSVRGMLHELQRVSGFDSTYLAAYHPERQAQEVRATANGGRLAIPASMVVPWNGSPCQRMVAGGARCTADLSDAFPRYALARFGGVRGHITVPVTAPDGTVHGTLCGASADPITPSLSMVRLFELFAALVARNLFGDADGDPKIEPGLPYVSVGNL